MDFLIYGIQFEYVWLLSLCIGYLIYTNAHLNIYRYTVYQSMYKHHPIMWEYVRLPVYVYNSCITYTLSQHYVLSAVVQIFYINIYFIYIYILSYAVLYRRNRYQEIKNTCMRMMVVTVCLYICNQDQTIYRSFTCTTLLAIATKAVRGYLLGHLRP